MILFINACVRKRSRTKQLADHLLEELDEPFTEVRLEEVRFPVVNEAFLNRRDRLLRKGNLGDPMFDLARQFAEADDIVIAAPFWDLSFPAMLKQYFEQINVTGITFDYTPEGVPQGLCRAKSLTFITTAGGEFVPEEYGFGYVEALARNYYGIPEVKMIRATGLDLDGADVEDIMEEAEEIIEEVAQED